MKRPFVVGDRVSVEGYDQLGVWWSNRGTIAQVFPSAADVWVNVDAGARNPIRIAVRSLRRLVPKTRREIWLSKPSPSTASCEYWNSTISSDPKCVNAGDFKNAIRFIEARPKKST